SASDGVPRESAVRPPGPRLRGRESAVVQVYLVELLIDDPGCVRGWIESGGRESQGEPSRVSRTLGGLHPVRPVPLAQVVVGFQEGASKDVGGDFGVGVEPRKRDGPTAGGTEEERAVAVGAGGPQRTPQVARHEWRIVSGPGRIARAE